MRLTLVPTDRIITIQATNGSGEVPGRVWQGSTDGGVLVVAVITRVATEDANDQAEFHRHLTPQPPCRAALEAFPNRMVL